MRVGVVQFVKGALGDRRARRAREFPDLVTIKAMGEGFTWETQDRARDIAAAERAWEEAKAMIADPAYSIVVLDELNIVLRYDYLPLAEVIGGPAEQAARTSTSSSPAATPSTELIEVADLVTEMTEVKHPFRAGVKAQAGIEF